MFYKRKYPNDVHGMFSYMPVSNGNKPSPFESQDLLVNSSLLLLHISS